MDTYVLSGVWLGVDEKMDTKKASCVEKRSDCVLTICYQTIIGSIVNIHNRAERAGRG